MMSIATELERNATLRENLKKTKQGIKSAVNYEIEIIGNEQIEEYPELIRGNQEALKQYIPTVKAEGKELSLNTIPLKIKEFALIGDTEQDSPNPGNKREIQVVKGNQTVHIGNMTKILNLSSIELAKIGDYKDYIFKNKPGSKYYNAELEESSWYECERINKITLTGNENWQIANGVFFTTSISDYASSTKKICVCDSYLAVDNVNNSVKVTENNTCCFYINNNNLRFYVRDDRFETVEDFKNYLAENNVTLYYILQTPRYIKITHEELIQQLEAIENTLMNDGITNLTIENEEGLQPTMYVEAYTDYRNLECIETVEESEEI